MLYAILLELIELLVVGVAYGLELFCDLITSIYGYIKPVKELLQ